MESKDLRNRTKLFSISVLELVDQLPNSIAARVIANQIAKSATSVGANYRAVCRARSDREFIAKMSIVAEESDETLYWLELIEFKQWIAAYKVRSVICEANELTSIFVTSLKTIKRRIKDHS